MKKAGKDCPQMMLSAREFFTCSGYRVILDDITTARTAATEISRLTAKIDELEREHSAGMAEYKSLVAQQHDGETRLRGTLSDIVENSQTRSTRSQRS